MRKFALTLGMPQSRVDRVFHVCGFDLESSLDHIIRFWINRCRTEQTWGKLVDASEKVGNKSLANKIQQKYCRYV